MTPTSTGTLRRDQYKTQCPIIYLKTKRYTSHAISCEDGWQGKINHAQPDLVKTLLHTAKYTLYWVSLTKQDTRKLLLLNFVQFCSHFPKKTCRYVYLTKTNYSYMWLTHPTNKPALWFLIIQSVDAPLPVKLNWLTSWHVTVLKYGDINSSCLTRWRLKQVVLSHNSQGRQSAH